jgi:hypothetical protein
VLEDTPLQLITGVLISSRTTKADARLPFTVTRDVVVDGVLVIPCGATVYGTIVAAKQAGLLVGASSLTLQLTELTRRSRTAARRAKGMHHDGPILNVRDESQ